MLQREVKKIVPKIIQMIPQRRPNARTILIPLISLSQHRQLLERRRGARRPRVAQCEERVEITRQTFSWVAKASRAHERQKRVVLGGHSTTCAGSVGTIGSDSEYIGNVHCSDCAPGSRPCGCSRASTAADRERVASACSLTQPQLIATARSCIVAPRGHR